MPKKNNDASEIPALEREIWSKKNVPLACLRCEHRDDWTGCRERCEYVKRRQVHELRKQASALQDTLSKCRQEDLDRAKKAREAGGKGNVT